MIIDMCVLSKNSVGYCEGGLTNIFEKGKGRRILIYGYTELDEWTTYLQIGNKVIHGHLGYFDCPYMINQLRQFCIEPRNLNKSKEGLKYAWYLLNVCQGKASFSEIKQFIEAMWQRRTISSDT